MSGAAQTHGAIPRTPDRSLGQWLRHWARIRPDEPAYLTAGTRLSWAETDARVSRLAERLVAFGFAPGDRVGVLLPDGPGVHVAFLACERAGLVVVGLGMRAGERELAHLLSRTGARGLLTGERHGDGRSSLLAAALRGRGVPLEHHLQLANEGAGPEPLRSDSEASAAIEKNGTAAAELRELGPDDVFLLNSTSGTTGMPKVVIHDQRRWMAFHELACRTGRLGADDVFMSVVPAPFGFGIWTSHATPLLLGVPTVLCPRFDGEESLRLIEAHRVTVLAAVSTQFILMLEAEGARHRDLRSLRALYTGGEAVPADRARQFEERTGSAVLQFYGSNETGAVSGTTLDDPPDKRLGTAGRPIPEMNLRLFDSEGRDVTETGRGQPGVRGPTLSRGYWNDDGANRDLLREDGWMLLGDRVEVDAEGYLRVVGRIDDFIIRGGKNISGPAVEEQVSRHPVVKLAAAVAMPDRVFGERVCVFAELKPGERLTLEELNAHLAREGVSREYFPERLEIVTELPRGSGGKIAKQRLREQAARFSV